MFQVTATPVAVTVAIGPVPPPPEIVATVTVISLTGLCPPTAVPNIFNVSPTVYPVPAVLPIVTV